MPYGMYISAQGAQAQSKRMEVIANNLANVETVGFKRDLAMQQAKYAEEIERGDVSPGTTEIQNIGGGMEFRATATDFSPGPIRHTGNPTDVAIQNNGFFQVRKGNEVLLTRAGNFRVTNKGDLVTQDGYPVLDDSKNPVSITPENGPWEIDSNGTVVQGRTKVDLGMVQPNSLSSLEKVGENMFRPTGEVKPLLPEQRAVAGGSLEMSGTDPTTEMTSLIETSRLLEANLNVLKSHNQILESLISRVLKA